MSMVLRMGSKVKVMIGSSGEAWCMFVSVQWNL